MRDKFGLPLHLLLHFRYVDGVMLIPLIVPLIQII